jgi:hypothetical protein
MGLAPREARLGRVEWKDRKHVDVGRACDLSIQLDPGAGPRPAREPSHCT